LYQTVARLATTVWNPHQQVGLVVGATYPEELKTVRGLVGDAPLLVPGIGAQGGDIEATVRHGLCSQGWGLLINSSRAILYASAGADFRQAAESTAQATYQAIALARAQVVQI
jgi:orotidine-5'-phosphate decarboxylase